MGIRFDLAPSSRRKSNTWTMSVLAASLVFVTLVGCDNGYGDADPSAAGPAPPQREVAEVESTDRRDNGQGSTLDELTGSRSTLGKAMDVARGIEADAAEYNKRLEKEMDNQNNQ